MIADYKMWPRGTTRPDFNLIKLVTLDYLGIPDAKVATHDEHHKQVTAKDSRTVLARKVMASLCKNILNMSTVEIASEMGVRSHSTFTGSGGWAGKFMTSPAGVEIHDQVLCRLVGWMHKAEKELTAEFDAAAITRASLRGNAGGAVTTTKGQDDAD
jgi:hypothetical protein